MKIDIELNKKQCMDLLYVNGYTHEDVVLYYTLEVDPYDKDGTNPGNLRPVNTTIAYEAGNKPDFLYKEYPMLDEAEDYLFDRVINRLFNKMIIDSLFNKN